MPFITKSEFPDLFPKSGQAIANLSDLKFAKIEAAAAEIISKKTGLAIPDDAEDCPAAIKLPAAWIVEYIYSSSSDNITPEKLSLINSNYKKAVTELENYNEKAKFQKIITFKPCGLL